MSDARRDPTVDAILEENRPYYNHKFHGEALERILPKVLDPGDKVVGVFWGSLNRGWINYRLGILTNITWLIATEQRVIFMTFTWLGWKKTLIRYDDIIQVDEKSRWPLASLERYLPKYVCNVLYYGKSSELKELIIVGLGRRISHLRRATYDGHQSIASRIIRHQMELNRQKR